MKYLHQAKISVFCKENEDENLILEKLKSFIPVNLEEEKIKVNRSSAGGFGNRKIIIFEIILSKDKHLNIFLKNLLKGLDKEQKELILRQAESRLDKKLNFFLRFDKGKLLNDDALWITDSGDCYHIKLSIAAFPAKREKALELIKEIFK